jgi:hypothetical protein
VRRQDLALLQAEASACAKELANVPNVRWQFISIISLILCTIFLFQHGTQRLVHVAERISESVSVRRTKTVNKGVETTHRTNPAMQFTICLA